MIEIYTDGGCTNNPNSENYQYGGWGFVVVRDNEIIHFDYGDSHGVTSNVMELVAILKALQWSQGKNTTIYSDSKYCVRGYNEWLNKWKQRGWHTSLGTTVENLRLWQTIDSLKQSNITLRWLRGHNGNKWNEFADELTWFARENK